MKSNIRRNAIQWTIRFKILFNFIKLQKGNDSHYQQTASKNCWTIQWNDLDSQLILWYLTFSILLKFFFFSLVSQFSVQIIFLELIHSRFITNAPQPKCSRAMIKCLSFVSKDLSVQFLHEISTRHLSQRLINRLTLLSVIVRAHTQVQKTILNASTQK